jgi:hypothetical protein
LFTSKFIWDTKFGIPNNTASQSVACGIITLYTSLHILKCEIAHGTLKNKANKQKDLEETDDLMILKLPMTVIT